MKLDELLNEWEKDSELTPDSQKDINNIPRLHNKYYKLLTKANRELRKVTDEYEALEYAREIYYLGRAKPEDYKQEPFGYSITKSELPMYKKADKNLIPLRNKMNNIQDFVDALKEIVKQINNRNFLIQNKLNVQRFEAGLN